MTRKQDQQIKLLDQILDKVQPTLRKDCNYRYFPSDTVFKTFWDIPKTKSWDFVPSNLEKIRTEASWSEERQSWRLPDLTVQKTKLPPAGEICSWQWCDINVAQPPFGGSGCGSWQWCDINVDGSHCAEDQVAASRWKWSMFVDDINVAKSPCGESVCCSWQWVEVLIFMAMLLIIRWGKFTEHCLATPKLVMGGK